MALYAGRTSHGNDKRKIRRAKNIAFVGKKIQDRTIKNACEMCDNFKNESSFLKLQFHFVECNFILKIWSHNCSCSLRTANGFPFSSHWKNAWKKIAHEIRWFGFHGNRKEKVRAEMARNIRRIIFPALDVFIYCNCLYRFTISFSLFSTISLSSLPSSWTKGQYSVFSAFHFCGFVLQWLQTYFSFVKK